MATWDFGGGCPCGVSKVCDCKANYCVHGNQIYCEECEKEMKYTEQMKLMSPRLNEDYMKKDEFDFGFSLHTEEELKTEDKTRLIGLKNMIMPLLNNLMANPEKPMINWPNRKEKIEEFIKKMDEYIGK